MRTAAQFPNSTGGRLPSAGTAEFGCSVETGLVSRLDHEMKLLCNLLMLLSALPLVFVGIMSLFIFAKPEYDLRLVVGSVVFSGALVGRCILEAGGRRVADDQQGAAVDDRRRECDRG